MSRFPTSTSLLFTTLLASFGAQGQQRPAPVLATDISRRADGSAELIRYERAAAPATADAPAALRAAYGLGQQSELRPVGAAETDAFGFSHQKYQQLYQGVPVEFTAATAHSRSGAVEYVTGETRHITDGALNVRPGLSAAAALPAALAFVGAKTYQWERPNEAAEAREHEGKATYRPAGELVIVDNVLGADEARRGRPVLAWKFNIYAAQPLSRAWVYVDAQTGEVVNQDAIIKHAGGSFQTRYSGTRPVQTTYVKVGVLPAYYKLHDTSRGGGIFTYNYQRTPGAVVDFKDSDNQWTAAEHSANQDQVAGDAHFGAAMTYDYWATVHGRNSFDGFGAPVRSYVHFDTLRGSGYDNAFWDGAGMYYGDGRTQFRPLTSLDVCAHELGHAVCEKTSNLVYQGESGALNEGFSDIWAACVEARTVSIYALPGKSTWTIGEEIMWSGTGALRSMSNPNQFSDPDTYQGHYWSSTAVGTWDNGGVHQNSGVLNFWFYLLSQGGAGTNDKGNAYTVTGIGIDKAARIAYLTEKLLSPTSNYASARAMAVQAATTLYGANSAEFRAVANAWYAVGVGSSIAFGTGSPLYIDYVALGAYTRTSGNDGGFSPASSLAPASALTRCVQHTLTYSRGGFVPVNAMARSYWNAYIDYNQDGDFTDAGERIMTNQWSYSSDGLQATFTVPVTALTGLTRMRIVMSGGADPVQCGSIGSGEVEEHFVNISTSLAAPLNLRVAAVRSASAMLTWTAVPGATAYKMQYRIGNGLLFLVPGTFTGTLQMLSGLTPGTTYTYRIAAVSSCNTTGSYSTVTFTTPTARPAGEAPADSLAATLAATAEALAAAHRIGANQAPDQTAAPLGTVPNRGAAIATATAFPNPATDVLSLTLTDANGTETSPATVEVFDLRGARVLSTAYDGNSGTLQVGTLTPGLYTATLRAAASAPVRVRFVKE